MHVIAQWEVAAALQSRRADATRGGEGAPSGAAAPRVSAVGTPGVFENTARIFEYMRTEMGAAAACDDGAADAAARTILLAHPDHLPRAMAIGEAALARAAGGRALARACGAPRLVPALQPYRLDWPTRGTPAGGRLNLFEGVTARVHTAGAVRDASWYDAAHGFFPDGEPQRWAHRREIWVAYEAWARAKGVATGVMGAAREGDELDEATTGG